MFQAALARPAGVGAAIAIPCCVLRQKDDPGGITVETAMSSVVDVLPGREVSLKPGWDMRPECDTSVKNDTLQEGRRGPRSR